MLTPCTVDVSCNTSYQPITAAKSQTSSLPDIGLSNVLAMFETYFTMTDKVITTRQRFLSLVLIKAFLWSYRELKPEHPEKTHLSDLKTKHYLTCQCREKLILH